MTHLDIGLTPKTYLLLMQTFETYPEIEKVILFGSRAKGNYKKGSDIDLVIKGERVTPRLLLQINAILNERLPIPYFIDVLSFSQIYNPSLLDHINRVGKVIYEKQPVVAF
jgi:predicted nucleotidyltransferase